MRRTDHIHRMKRHIFVVTVFVMVLMVMSISVVLAGTLPKVVIVAKGGTMATKVDPKIGGPVPRYLLLVETGADFRQKRSLLPPLNALSQMFKKRLPFKAVLAKQSKKLSLLFLVCCAIR
jgi:hypothetical protein